MWTVSVYAVGVVVSRFGAGHAIVHKQDIHVVERGAVGARSQHDVVVCASRRKPRLGFCSQQ